LAIEKEQSYCLDNLQVSFLMENDDFKPIEPEKVFKGLIEFKKRVPLNEKTRFVYTNIQFFLNNRSCKTITYKTRKISDTV